VYLTVGFPDPDATVSLALAALEGGADIIELGVPFSDPLAEGVTIQRSSAYAVERGVTVETCLQAATRLRAAGATAPLYLMGYYNPFLQYGHQRLAAAASKAGVDGLIVADLPPEESDAIDAALKAQGLDLVFLLAPTSTDRRIASVAARARGFIYCVSLTGITGARAEVSKQAFGLLDRVRGETSLPLALGFGISRPEHVKQIAPLVDIIVVGSAFIDLIDKTPAGQREQAVKEFVGSLAEAAKRERAAREP
jgi:tryptophan synthase alpha chain